MTPNRALGIRTAAAAANKPYWQLLRGVTVPVPTPKIVSLTANLVTAVQTELLLVKSATVGTPNAPVFANKLFDPGAGDTDNTRFAVAWAVEPTIGATTTAIGRVTLPAILGATVVWEFGDGELEVQAGESLLLWNVGAAPGAALDVSCFFQGN
jgi:hypothetical protein